MGCYIGNYVATFITELSCNVNCAYICTQVKSQNEKLRAQLKEKEIYEKVLQQQISKAEEKYSEVNSKFEKLKMFSNIKEMENQLSDVLRKMVDVKSAFGYIDIVKMKYIKEVKIYILLSVIIYPMLDAYK